MGDDFTADTLTTGVLAAGGELKGAVDYNSDKDWIKTQLTAGVLYKFDLLGSRSSGGTLEDPYLRIRDSRGSSIESAYNGGAADDPNIGFIPTTSGTYYLEASSFYSGKTGSYTLRINQSASSDDFTADTLTTGVLAAGGELKGAVDYNSDKDWIKTQLTAGVLYKFDLLGSRSSGGTLEDPYLRIRDSRGSSIETAYNGGAANDPNIGFIPTTSGTYYLEASSFYSGKTGSYTIRVNSAGAFTINSATSQVNEESTAIFNLTTTNVTSGTSVNYEISGVTASDISRSNLSGTVTVGPDGKATISIPITADNLTEGDEILTVTVQGKNASTIIKDTSQSTPTTAKSSLTILVDKGVLGPSPFILKDLPEEITSNGNTVTSHLIIYNGVKFNYSDIDALITTVVREGNFTDEFRNEILDLAPNLKDVRYEDLVKLVGLGNIDIVILNVAGADGNFVG